jgi:predicted nucleic acid-binding protein
VAVIADSGALYGLYDTSDKHHARLRIALQAERGPIIIPAPILSEIDYLLRARLGVDAELDFFDDIVGGSFTLEQFSYPDLIRARELLGKYSELDLGIAAAAVIVTADRLRIERILTVDERDFRAVRSESGKPFVLLPADLDPATST